jgi:signal transduction histidine kinase
VKGIIYSWPIKITAVILSLLMCIVSTASIMGTAVFMSMGLYSQQEWNYYATSLCENRTYYNARMVIYEYYLAYQMYEKEGAGDRSRQQELEWYEKKFSNENTNFRFRIEEEGGEAISTYQDDESYGFETEYMFEIYSEELGKDIQHTIHCYVVDPMTANDEYQTDMYWYGEGFRYRYTVLNLAIAASVFLIVLCIYLICAAGHKRGTEEIYAGGLHKLPFDFLTGLVILGGFCLMGLLETMNGYGDLLTDLIRACVGVTGIFALGLFYVMSLAVRCKNHYLWKGTIVYRCYRGIKEMIIRLYQNRSFLGKALLWILLAGASTFIIGVMCIDENSAGAFLFYILFACVVAASLAMAFQLRYKKIRQGIQKIALGDLNARVDTKGLYGELKEQAENLNSINEAVRAAVEKQLKSERMKTELITNVSHDIKTPLTSIVNYVDLLKKQEVQDETAKEYIEVLERQSIRLKKLIEDLIEASKASSGNIAVNMGRLDMTELLKQLLGEYSDRLKEHNLELVLTAPEYEMPVMADGQLLWRVFDNLLSNVQKYSQAGTRVYLDVKEEEGCAVITFRNISRYALNISGEELMERFVRGDSSRHTEGSGLGLSIAKSLTELMNGRFDILVDGDLFKVQVIFNKLV